MKKSKNTSYTKERLIADNYRVVYKLNSHRVSVDFKSVGIKKVLYVFSNEDVTTISIMAYHKKSFVTNHGYCSSIHFIIPQNLS